MPSDLVFHVKEDVYGYGQYPVSLWTELEYYDCIVKDLFTAAPLNPTSTTTP